MTRAYEGCATLDKLVIGVVLAYISHRQAPHRSPLRPGAQDSWPWPERVAANGTYCLGPKRLH
eukprot:CAMPEP_0179015356 /NCGR_PEP_ID=MMETSP0796-20121207/2744_1 /TAXON_ID=73915 /ORGANISM="Pyrodinium bahamense, Strain pbaha01" /LENGTH=62 /DNA_ID=CAMNT_0020710977 /DNA_START=33 /DNA_END=222 /DNA_ORIENTATION=-